MNKLFFIRHGESLSNAGGVTMEHGAIPLSPRGQQQAVAIADALPVKPARVLVSPMLRTLQTAEPYCARHRIQPTRCDSLAEFSVIDPALIEGLDGAQRKPFVTEYWANPDPNRRLGPRADTFLEFNDRVTEFMALMPELPNLTVVFGHGIWFGLLQWRLLGFSIHTADDMRRFRRFQQGFPMPNCAVYSLQNFDGSYWSTKAEIAVMQSLSGKWIGGNHATAA